MTKKLQVIFLALTPLALSISLLLYRNPGAKSNSRSLTKNGPMQNGQSNKNQKGQHYILDFQKEIEEALNKDNAAVTGVIQKNANMVTLTINGMIKESIEKEFAGDKGAALKTIKGAERVAEVAYNTLKNTNGKSLIENYYHWTSEQKRMVMEAKKRMMEGQESAKKGDVESAVIKFQEAGQLYKHVNDKIGEMGALLGLGNAYLISYDYLKSINCFKKAYKISEQIGDQHSALYALHAIARYEYLAGEYSSAIKTLNQALDIARNYNDDTLLSSLLNDKGYVYQLMGNYEDARWYYHDALKYTQNKHKIKDIYVSLGETEYLLKNYRKADEMLDRVLIDPDKNKDQHSIPHAYVLKGSCYVGMGRYREADQYFRRALNFPVKDCKNVRINTLIGMGKMYALESKDEEALKCYQAVMDHGAWYPYAKA